MKKLEQVFDDIKTFSENAEFIPTGFSKLDAELDGGFMKKELIVIGGFTGTGKSFTGGQILLNAAKNMFNCIYFSLEISNEMVVSRLIGQECNLKPTRIMAGLLTEEENNKKIQAQAKISTYNNQMIFSDDQYYFSDISKTIKSGDYDLVVIDFIQNIMEKGEEYEKLSKISLELQKLAKEKNCCIIVMSQISNEAFKTKALEYKGSGSIATVCDLGIFLVRQEDTMDKMLLKVRKNRRGRSGIEVELQSIYPGGKIVEL